MNSGGTTMLPHAGFWDGQTLVAEYAGATCEWTINYFDSPDDGTVVDAIVLSDLIINGTEVDLDGNGQLQAADRDALLDAIANPPTIHIASAQNLFDLNADEAVVDLDLSVFDANFSVPAAGSAVPEPTTWTLLLLSVLGALMGRTRYSARSRVRGT